MSLLWISPTSRELHTQPDCWPKISVNAGQPAALIVPSCCVSPQGLFSGRRLDVLPSLTCRVL